MPVLVVGNFPPVPGPVTAATLAQVRAGVAAGASVRTASPRPSGAELVVPATGWRAGRRLDAARRSTGADELVLAVADGLPARAPADRGGRRAVGVADAAAAVTSTLWALRRFRHVTLVVADDPGVPVTLLRPLWRSADRVLVTGAALAGRLGVPAGVAEVVAAPGPLRGVVATGTVTTLGPPEAPPWEMPRYVAGRAARAVLGPAFPPTWAALRWAGRPVLRRLRARRAG
ncbi:MAG TPA: hypothetical protein VFP61_14270 [Acidimicrobiales bacterium]|nr:hypothetical protein [Acidimicrobiales bacterium]